MNTAQTALVKRAVAAPLIPGRRRACTQSMVRVEDPVMVMEARVETEAAMSSTSTTPSRTVGRWASTSILGTR